MEKLEKVYHSYGSSMEPIEYPEEKMLNTAQRVTYNAEVTKYYDRREAVRIMVRDLTNDKLFSLLRDIIGNDVEIPVTATCDLGYIDASGCDHYIRYNVCEGCIHCPDETWEDREERETKDGVK